jgi:hypothetical protein
MQNGLACGTETAKVAVEPVRSQYVIDNKNIIMKLILNRTAASLLCLYDEGYSIG